MHKSHSPHGSPHHPRPHRPPAPIPAPAPNPPQPHPAWVATCRPACCACPYRPPPPLSLSPPSREGPAHRKRHGALGSLRGSLQGSAPGEAEEPHPYHAYHLTALTSPSRCAGTACAAAARTRRRLRLYGPEMHARRNGGSALRLAAHLLGSAPGPGPLGAGSTQVTARASMPQRLVWRA